MPSSDRKEKLVQWDFQNIFVENTTDSQCYRLTNQQVAALLVTLQQMAWLTRWSNAIDFDDEITEFVGDLSNALMQRGKFCGNGNGGSSGGALNLPDCVNLLDCNEDGEIDTIEIYEMECEQLVNINVYGGCGCGCDGGAGTSGMGAINSDNGFNVPVNPGTGGLPSDTPSYCDVITSWVPRVAQQASEFFLVLEDAVQQFGEAGIDKIVDAVIGDFPFVGNAGAAFVDWLTDVIEIGAQNIRQMYEDANHIEEMQVAYIKTFGDNPAPSQFTRADFRNWAGKMPQTFSTIPTIIIFPRQTFRLFSEFFDLSALNARLRTSVGTGTPGLCSFLYDLAGVAQPVVNLPSGGTGGIIGTDLCGTYDFRTGAGNWQVIPQDVAPEPYLYGDTAYSASQSGWARGFVENANPRLGIRGIAQSSDIVSITTVRITGSSNNPQGAGSPIVSLFKAGVQSFTQEVQWPVQDGSEQTVTFNTGGVDADEIRVEVKSLRGNDILVVNQVEIICS